MVDAGAFDAVRLKTEGIDEIEIPIPRDLDDLPEEMLFLVFGDDQAFQGTVKHPKSQGQEGQGKDDDQ